MKSYRFPAFKNKFIFATMGGQSWRPTLKEMTNFIELCKKYKLSSEDINCMPGVMAKTFDAVVNEQEHVFLLHIKDDSLRSYFTDADVSFWKDTFEQMALSTEDYNLVLAVYGVDLERMKKNLLIFL